MDIVIGSGPSGIAAAHGLLSRGRRVTLIDAGKRLEEAPAALRGELAAQAPEDWPDTLLARYKAGQFDGPPGDIRRFGSSFAIEDEASTFAAAQGIGLRASRAVGGLSNFWGSAVLPNRAEDMADWPISASDLNPHYKAVAGFMPIAAGPGNLDGLLPAFVPEGDSRLDQSPQARGLTDRLAAAEDRLAAQGLHWGRARQAVAAGCKHCGLCLHGCPWGQIFSADQALERLKAYEDFTYRTAAPVRHLSEDGDEVQVHLESGEVLYGARVFVGAGVLETARIVLGSFPMLGPVLHLADSQHMFTPMLHTWGLDEAPDTAAAHALAEVFVEMEAPKLSHGLIHSQLYTWNEFYEREMLSKYGRLPGMRPVFERLSRRLIVAQTFLHSDHCGTIALSRASDGRLEAQAIPKASEDKTMAAARRRLARAMRKVGLIALTFAGHKGAPGSSFHVGGSLPMAAEPVRGQADIYGRLAGTTRVHVVDASVLPTIPATTITFSVMANAHRIGSTAP